jgi:FdhD protein
MNPGVTTVPIQRLRSDSPAELTTDRVAVEEPLEIRIHNEPLVTLMRTPGDDRELVTGFLFTEGLIAKREDILEIAPCPHLPTGRRGTILNVTPAPHLNLNLTEIRRLFIASSSCGLCSKASLASERPPEPIVQSFGCVSPETLHSLPARLHTAQKTFAQTGGLHASAWFDLLGNLLLLREDVGRHNALDKIIGERLLRNANDSEGILLVSGRVAYEIVQKALAARFPIIAAISAPTGLAVEYAEENNQTLIGFLRDGRMNIYTHPQRVRGE